MALTMDRHYPLAKRLPPGLAVILVICILLIASQGWAVEMAASVVAVRGGVEVERQEGRSPLRVKDPLYVNDTIHTNDGRVQIMFTDHSLINLGLGTVLAIRDYRYRPEDKDAVLKTMVAEGVFRVVGGAVAKLAPQHFTTETPTATIGVRGSMYAGMFKDNQLTVLFEGGVGVYVTNVMGTVELTEVNLLTTVAAGQGPTTPQPASPAAIKALSQALTPGAGEASEVQTPAPGMVEQAAPVSQGAGPNWGSDQAGQSIKDAVGAATQQNTATEAASQAQSQAKQETPVVIPAPSPSGQGTSGEIVPPPSPVTGTNGGRPLSQPPPSRF